MNGAECFIPCHGCRVYFSGTREKLGLIHFFSARTVSHLRISLTDQTQLEENDCYVTKTPAPLSPSLTYSRFSSVSKKIFVLQISFNAPDHFLVRVRRPRLPPRAHRWSMVHHEEDLPVDPDELPESRQTKSTGGRLDLRRY